MSGFFIFSGITLLSLFAATVLFLFFIITRKGNKSENILLAALLFIFCIQIFYSYTISNYAYMYFLSLHKSLFVLRQTSFLTGPLIYLYLCSFSKKVNYLNRKNIIHVLPFIASILFLPLFYSFTTKFVIWKSDVNLYDTILILTHNLIYIVLSVLNIKAFHSNFSTFFKNIRASYYITWLHMLLLGFIVIWIVNLNSFVIYMIVRNPGWCAYTGSIFALVLFLFMNSMMFILLLKPDIYYVVEKYKSTSIAEADKKEYLQQLNNYMELRKPYLNPDISLEILAKELSLNRRILSQVINECCRNNFKGLMNEYRIRESIKLLSQPENDGKTILEILYEVGFNSKSIFNNMFKKHTGLTPQEFRAKQCKKLASELILPL